jgi:hypothetical protein
MLSSTLAVEIGYLPHASFECLEEKCQEIGRMLGSLIKASSTTHHP